MLYRNIYFNEFKLLSKYVLSIYEISTKDDCNYVTIPTGNIGLSFLLKGNAILQRNGMDYNLPEASAYGLIKKPQVIFLNGQTREITFTFPPWFFQLFISESMHQMTDGLPVHMPSIFDAYCVEKLFFSIYTAGSDGQILEAMESFLMQQLRLNKYNTTLLSANHLIQNDSSLSINSMCEKLGVSGTKLRKLFYDNIGLSPKEMVKINRVQRALHYQANSEESLTALGYRLGYFDQSHFIHDFKSILGIAPLQYFRKKALTVDFYNFGRWRWDSFV